MGENVGDGEVLVMAVVGLLVLLGVWVVDVLVDVKRERRVVKGMVEMRWL